MVCRQLSVGDVCITLRHSERGEPSGTSSSADRPGPSGLQHQQHSSSHSQQSSRRLSLPVIRVERRPGVKSAPPRESSSEEFALLDIRQYLRRRRRKSNPLLIA
ncbi:unnamed protein product [Gongylonema pulchrum]|uniref:AXH domain-containing protein n=1 Tax=Gongylonema pulchrum TaxID=637853 RepID=A0A3P6R9F4_9BILA|nr:unnamed protein product [Gongylonema pulchrum]